MSDVDPAYAQTRRRGSSGVITRVTTSSADPETGIKTDTEVNTTVRWLVKQPTKYSKIIRADAVQQRVGNTTFLIYLPDVDAVFTELTQEDYITYKTKRYEIVSTDTEDNSLLITANQMAR